VTDDKRLIEDYLPIEAISAEASSEPRTKGHISTMHIWRARRPLVACRAAVYGALVAPWQFVPSNGSDETKKSLGRANSAKFVKALSQFPGAPWTIQEAQRHILAAHAERLSRELGKSISTDDIETGYAPRPRVLDMFAGGGAIPLEAARLGCEVHAIDLNPVAHLIELCSLTFPQQFGSTLAEDVEKWARKVLDNTLKGVEDLYARIPRPASASSMEQHPLQTGSLAPPIENLSVVAYYWTRTAPCPNPSCRGTVPLYRQTWLRKKESWYVALKPEPDLLHKVVRFRVVEAGSEAELGFDPGEGSESSATVCPFCRTALEGEYVRSYGDNTGFGQQLMCVIALNPQGTGKIFLTGESLADGELERHAKANERSRQLEQELGNSSLDETIPPTGNAGLATGNSYLYGIRTFREMFTPRQRYTLLTMAREIRLAHGAMLKEGMPPARVLAVTTYLGIWLSRLTDRFNGLARWDSSRENIQGLTSMKRFAMAWDFPEVNIFGGASGDAWGNLDYITAVIRQEGTSRLPANCLRGSATELPFADGFFDAVVTDPPYYDNESYAELSDVCYVWLRPTIGFLYPEHFATALTPKKKECVAAAYRQGGKASAKTFYENCLFQSLQEAHRVTKPGGILVMVYAHKTTLGWSTLVDAIRRAGYEVSEAWPLDTEAKARVAHRGDAALASSIFLVARMREKAATVGEYESDVVPQLGAIVRERVETLWDMGISGADLMIACVGAGLRAFTKYARVEYGNGEEVPAERFLAEVETVVLETIMGKLSKAVGTNHGRTTLAGLDPATRFYVLWRYTYGAVELDAGEAIIFANGTHVELDGLNGLSSGSQPLLEKKTVKKESKYRLLDYSERGDDARLGGPSEDGRSAPLIDPLHRLLWLMEQHPSRIPDFLREARPNTEQMRLVAQALTGPALKGGELGEVASGTELAALTKLTANWRSVVEDAGAMPPEREERRTGQSKLRFEKGDR
jgi:putative DNA methylase